MYRLLPTEEDAREEDRTASGSTFDPETSTPRRPFQSMAQKFKAIAPSFLYPGGGNGSSSSSTPSWRPWSTPSRAGNNNTSRSRQRTNSNTSGRTNRSQHQPQQHHNHGGFRYQPPVKKKVEYKLDGLFLKRISRLFEILFSKQSKVTWLYIGMTLFCCLNEGIVYFVGTIPSRYYKVLGDKDSAAFFRLLVVSLFTVFLAGLGKSVIFLMGSLLSLEARRTLTLYFHRIYIQPKLFYRILTMHDEEIDNPDQRITQDIDKLAEALRKMVESLIISPLAIAFYTWQCWQMTGYIGPLCIYGYFIFSAITSRLLINPIVDAIFFKESAEGYFRFLHVRFRQFTESITFSRGEGEAKMAADDSLENLLCSQLNVIYKEVPLNFLQQSVSYFGSILSYVIIAIPIFLGRYDGMPASDLSAIISKTSFVSMYLTYQFSQIIKCGAEFSDLAGYTSRLGQLMEALDMLSTEMENIAIDYPHEESLSMDSSIRLENVTFSTPAGELIVSGFTHRFEAGVNTVIVGPNGSGKTSILRVMGGLWPVSKGQVILPHQYRKDVIFLPQTPYMTYGTLREQLVYPHKEMASSVTDADILRVLKLVRLEHLLETVEDFDQVYTLDWNKMLSPGEQQKLAFARLFYVKPIFAVLDEATCSMDMTSEKEMFRQCRLLNITCITVCHQANLEKYHQQRIALDGHGGWTCSEIDSPRPRSQSFGGVSSGVGAPALMTTTTTTTDNVEVDTLAGPGDDFE
ncbi:ABC transporter transmembrane region 2-domain-containing protein [Linnemannia elongata]|nr:ABC transporter transmembrane region 2-domain-containing protein [Linnemannia elongata]